MLQVLVGHCSQVLHSPTSQCWVQGSSHELRDEGLCEELQFSEPTCSKLTPSLYVYRRNDSHTRSKGSEALE